MAPSNGRRWRCSEFSKRAAPICRSIRRTRPRAANDVRRCGLPPRGDRRPRRPAPHVTSLEFDRGPAFPPSIVSPLNAMRQPRLHHVHVGLDRAGQGIADRTARGSPAGKGRQLPRSSAPDERTAPGRLAGVRCFDIRDLGAAAEWRMCLRAGRARFSIRSRCAALIVHGASRRCGAPPGCSTRWLTPTCGCSPDLSQVLTGGERLSPSHVRRFREALPHVRLINGYGPTENTTFTACHAICDVDAATFRSAGRSRTRRVYVLDADLHPCADRRPRRICAGGDGLARGYLNDPRADGRAVRATSLPPGNASIAPAMPAAGAPMACWSSPAASISS